MNRPHTIVVVLSALLAIGARALAAGDPPRDLLIIDTHIDLPERLLGEYEDVSGRVKKGDFDYVRAREGGLSVAFMSIFVPAGKGNDSAATAHAERLMKMVEELAARAPEKFTLVRSPADIRSQAGGDRVMLAMGMENGSPIAGDLRKVRYFYDRGIRYITLTHAKSNHICDSSYDEERPWNGLSPFGREVVAEMNRLGIMVDISHVTDSTFYQVMRLSKAPVIASHSSCRHFTPGWERNMNDEMIRLLAAKGGVIQIAFGSDFLKDELRASRRRADVEARKELERRGMKRNDPRADALLERFRRQHPPLFGTVADVADHIDHVVRLTGIDHVGLGSDFDGVGDELPEGLKDVSGYPNLIRELQRRGYSDADLRKICGENLLRVWTEVQQVAAGLQKGTDR